MNLGTLMVSLGVDTTQLDTASKAMNTTAQKFRTFGYLATAALTAPMIAFGKASFTAARDYEYAMQKIVGLTGVAQTTVNDWSKDVLKMGPELARSPKELAEALYFISSSGIKGAEAMNVLRLSAKAATSGLGETQQIADLLTSALNAYAGTGLTASYATDVLVAAVREGKAEASSFSTAMGQVIPIAAQLGVSFDQVAGGMAAITLTGSSASSAAVYLKGVFNSLLTASAQGEKALNSVGTSYGELRRILGQEGLIPLMQKLRDIQTKYGDEILSDVLPNIRALTGYLSISGKNFKYNTELMKRVTESTGSLGNAFAAVADTIKVRYDQAISRAQTSLITLGKTIAETILPFIEKWSKKLEEMVNHFNSLTDAQRKHRLEIAAWIAAAGPISLFISLMIYSITGLVNAAKLAIGVFNKLKVAMLSNPYLAAAAAVGLVVAGVINYAKKVKDLAEAHDSFNTTLVQVNGNLKKLKDLTSEDIGTMSISALTAALAKTQQEWQNAYTQYQQGLKNRKDLSWFDNLLGAGKNNDAFIQKQIDKINQLKKIYEDLQNAILEAQMEMRMGKVTKEQKKQIANYQKLQEEIKKTHRLILEQYEAQLKKGTDKLDSNNIIKELNSKQPIDFQKFFFKARTLSANSTPDPTTILENWYARGLISERTYLDDKYKMDIANAQENADARLAIETQYYKDLRELRFKDVNTYLEAASTAISSISALIEASKQRELSAVGDSAKRREQIERAYFQKQKAWAIAQAIINGAIAVTNLLANTPGSVLNPATWVGMGMAAASTAAQVAIIAGQKMKEGGEVPSGFPNDTYPALLTSGERIIPKPKRLDLERQKDPYDLLKDVVFHIGDNELVGIFSRRSRKTKSFA